MMWQWCFLCLSYIWWGIADNGAQKVWHQCKISASCGRQPAEKLTSKAKKKMQPNKVAAYKDIWHDARNVFYGFAPNWAKSMCFLCSARYMAPTRSKVREWSNPSLMLTLMRRVLKSKCCSLTVFPFQGAWGRSHDERWDWRGAKSTSRDDSRF